MTERLAVVHHPNLSPNDRGEGAVLYRCQRGWQQRCCAAPPLSVEAGETRVNASQSPSAVREGQGRTAVEAVAVRKTHQLRCALARVVVERTTPTRTRGGRQGRRSCLPSRTAVHATAGERAAHDQLEQDTREDRGIFPVARRPHRSALDARRSHGQRLLAAPWRCRRSQQGNIGRRRDRSQTELASRRAHFAAAFSRDKQQG
jgi:hypothetical protein